MRDHIHALCYILLSIVTNKNLSSQEIMYNILNDRYPVETLSNDIRYGLVIFPA